MQGYMGGMWKMSDLILLLDFDGVIHQYTSGWQGPGVIPDPPVPGAFEAIQKYSESFDVMVYSSRSQYPEGLQAMKKWFVENGWPGELKADGWEPEGLKFPTVKPAAFLTIDDRCIQFQGTWPEAEELLGFRPWNKKG